MFPYCSLYLAGRRQNRKELCHGQKSRLKRTGAKDQDKAISQMDKPS